MYGRGRPYDPGEGDDNARQGEDGTRSYTEAVADERVYHDDHHRGNARRDEDVRLELFLHLGQT